MKRKLLALILILSNFYFQATAQGDLLIAPKRVVFDGNKQREELNLVNIGKDTCTYSISFLNYEMQEDGSFKIIEKPDSSIMIASPYLRFFPRQITLAPGEPQIIMLQCRRSATMKTGEYRSHLQFKPLKNNTPLGSKDSLKDSTKLSVEITPIYGISIPVIIRTGEQKITTSFTNLKLIEKQGTISTLEFTINRAGNCSTYGNLLVEYIAGQNKSIVVGIIKGVGVYTNIDHRNVSVKLNQVKDVAFKTGNLKVRYTTPDDAKYMVYAEKEASVDELIRANYAITSAK